PLNIECFEQFRQEQQARVVVLVDVCREHPGAENVKPGQTDHFPKILLGVLKHLGETDTPRLEVSLIDMAHALRQIVDDTGSNVVTQEFVRYRARATILAALQLIAMTW